MRMLAMPKAAESWLLTSLREKLIKVGAKVVSHRRYHVPNGRGRARHGECSRISYRLSPGCERHPCRREGLDHMMRQETPAEVHLDANKAERFNVSA
jgi:hypothetical protein